MWFEWHVLQTLRPRKLIQRFDQRITELEQPRMLRNVRNYPEVHEGERGLLFRGTGEGNTLETLTVRV